MDALKDQGTRKTYLRLLDDIYEECTGRITLHRQSGKFPIGKEVRQGDTISPKLFTACLESVFRRLGWKNLGLHMNGEYLSHLRFADYIVLLTESAELQKMINYSQRGLLWC